MAHLAQVSILLDPFHVTVERIGSLGRTTDSIAYEAARAIYPSLVNIEVGLDEGSLFTKITVIGGLLLGTYHAIAIYPDFKEGIVELCDDAEAFGAAIQHHFLKASGALPEQVIRVRKSSQTPGKVIRLLKKIEKIEKSQSHQSPAEIKKQLADASRQLKGILQDTTPEEAAAITAQIELQNVPPIRQWPTREPITAEIPRIAVEHEQLALPKSRKMYSARGYAAPKKVPLRYHNSFSVSPNDGESPPRIAPPTRR